MKPPSESEKTKPNKANFKIGKMNLSSVKSMDYVKKRDWTLGENKPKTKPIQTQTNPIQTQFKPNPQYAIRCTLHKPRPPAKSLPPTWAK